MGFKKFALSILLTLVVSVPAFADGNGGSNGGGGNPRYALPEPIKTLKKAHGELHGPSARAIANSMINTNYEKDLGRYDAREEIAPADAKEILIRIQVAR